MYKNELWYPSFDYDNLRLNGTTFSAAEEMIASVAEANRAGHNWLTDQCEGEGRPPGRHRPK
jgi:hypothetical protein